MDGSRSSTNRLPSTSSTPGRSGTEDSGRSGALEHTLYTGSYSLCRVPGFDGPCVKVAFPLPNGSAHVIMRPESAPDGSFTVRSSGKGFGDPGFYFFVEAGRGQGWSRYLRALKEDIRVYVDPRGHLRADHDLQIWVRRFSGCAIECDGELPDISARSSRARCAAPSLPCRYPRDLLLPRTCS